MKNVIAVLLIFAIYTTSASAVIFTANTDAAAELSENDTFTVTVELDASDLVATNPSTTGFAFSVLIDGAVFEVVSGTQADPVMQFDFMGTLLNGIDLLSPLPPNNGQDVNTVRMGVWGSTSPLDPTGSPVADLTWGVEPMIATVVLRVLPGAPDGSYDLDPAFAGGDGFDPQSVADAAVFNGVTVTVPEPGVGVLSMSMLLSVLGIVRVRRCVVR